MILLFVAPAQISHKFVGSTRRELGMWMLFAFVVRMVLLVMVGVQMGTLILIG